jgi:hypothetical protein
MGRTRQDDTDEECHPSIESVYDGGPTNGGSNLGDEDLSSLDNDFDNNNIDNEYSMSNVNESDNEMD